ncbi:helix-turn-helix domain-containing protein [Streptomyces sp. NPDC012794]|uniref:helix-turn-helix domain-containing protein n=1 Tax=Streptomyces sp. NPDC012794 TaxID=3364850 RepID=UPI003673C103
MERPRATYLVNGAAIRTRRMELGMDLAECAAEVGISRAYLDQLELGYRRRPSPRIYAALRTALRVTDNQLLAAEENTPKE